MDHAEREYLPAANVHRLLCERTGCGLNPIVDKPPHPDCPPGFYSPAAVLEAGQEGELEVLVAAGLTALPLHIPDLLSLAEGVGNDPDALLVVSRWHQGTQAEEGELTAYNLQYLHQCVRAVLPPLERVLVGRNQRADVVPEQLLCSAGAVMAVLRALM